MMCVNKNKIFNDYNVLIEINKELLILRNKQKLLLTNIKNTCFNILNTMGSVERILINEQLSINKNFLLKPSFLFFGYFKQEFYKIKFKDNGIIVTYNLKRDIGDGEYKSNFFKTFIPYIYFDISTTEISRLHRDWSLNYINNYIRKQKIKKLKNIVDAEYEQYLKLKDKFENKN